MILQDFKVTAIPNVPFDGFFSAMASETYSFVSNSGARTFSVIQNGQVIWQKNATYPTTVWGTDSGIVYVGWMENGSAAGTLEAYNFLTGDLLWSRSVGLQSYFIKGDSDGNLLYVQQDFIGANSYGPIRLIKVDKDTGQEIWSAYPYGDSVVASSTSPVAIGPDGYYISTNGPRELIKYDFNGVEIWRAVVSVDSQGIAVSGDDIWTVGVVDPGFDFLISKISAQTGTVTSEIAFTPESLGFGAGSRAIWGMDIVVHNGGVYVSGILFNDPAINPSLGDTEVFIAKFSSALEPIWSRTLGGEGNDGVAARGTSLSVDAGGTFTLFSATSGSNSVEGVPLQSDKNLVIYSFSDPEFGGRYSPVITSNGGGASSTVILAENTVVVTTVIAVDADPGSSLSYRINGGADAALFSIDASTGVLTFFNAPNFEAPGDAGGDNVYDVVVETTDGTLTDTQILAVTVANANDAPTGAVVIQGAVREGQTLTASTSTIADADGLGSFSYIWYRNGTEIAGATAASYLLTAADVGAAITARVSYTDGFSSAETLLSAETALVASASIPGVTLTGTARANKLNGTGGDDVLSGLAGNDGLTALGGNDLLLGGNGNDTLSGGLGDDTLDGGAGTDTASYADATSGVTVNLAITAAQETGAGADLLIGIENLIGGNGNDSLTGNAGANNINGGGGDDLIMGGAGNDTLAGGANGAAGDTVSYADAAAGVTVSLAVTRAQNTGTSTGSDVLSGFENLEGSGFADQLTGSTGNNVISGGAGADRIIGGNGTDYLYGGEGSDTFVFTANSHSRVGIARDVIFDLELGDVLDFSAIDANTGLRGNQAFTFIGAATFTAAGQLRMYETDGTWLVEGNTGGTIDPDFQLELRHWNGSTFSDILL